MNEAEYEELWRSRRVLSVEAVGENDQRSKPGQNTFDTTQCFA